MGDTPNDNPPAAETASAQALICAGCGYSLDGLASPGLCPGCSIPTPSPKEALTATVGRGASWVMLGTALAKFAALVAQIILGWKLTEVQFGVFATAAAIGWFIAILKDAGTNAMLLQRGAVNYERVAGPLFWMNTTLSVACALAISGIAAWILAVPPPIHFDLLLLPPGIGVWVRTSPPHHPEVAWILFVIAASTPMQVVGGQLQTKLRQDLRFARYSHIVLVSALVRQVATVALALSGFGAMSFAWPYILCAVYEGVASHRATKEAVWKRSPEFHLWGSFLRQGSWTLIGTASNFALDQGAYLILGSMVTKAITGQFYFAFQLTAQAGVLLGFAVQQVLIPALVQLNSQAQRQAEAALRALRVMSLIGSVVCVGLSVGIEPLEAIIWRERWAPAVPAIIILGIFFAWRINFGLTTALLHAQGRFKRHAFLTAFEGVGVMVCTAIAASFKDADVSFISWWVGGWLMVGRFVVTMLVFREMKIDALRIIAAVLWSWSLAVGCGLLTLGLDRWLHLLARFTALSRGLLSTLSVQHPRIWMVEVPAQAMRLVVLGSTFLLFFLIASRSLVRIHLVDTLNVVPARFRGHVARLLALTPAAPRPGSGGPG